MIKLIITFCWFTAIICGVAAMFMNYDTKKEIRQILFGTNGKWKGSRTIIKDSNLWLYLLIILTFPFCAAGPIGCIVEIIILGGIAFFL